MTVQRVIFIIAWIAQERSEERVVGDWRERDRERSETSLELPTSAYLYFSEMLQVSISVFRQKHMCSVWNIFLLPVITPAMLICTNRHEHLQLIQIVIYVNIRIILFVYRRFLDLQN